MRRRGEHGFSLMLVLFVIVIIGMAIGALSGLLNNRAMAFQQQARRAALRSLGDGAMAATLAHLADRPGYRGLPEQQLGAGRIASEVTPRPGHAVHVVATAQARGWVELTVADVDMTTGHPLITSWQRTPPHRDGAS